MNCKIFLLTYIIYWRSDINILKIYTAHHKYILSNFVIHILVLYVIKYNYAIHKI